MNMHFVVVEQSVENILEYAIFFFFQKNVHNLFFTSTFLRQHGGALVSGFELANGPGHFYAFLCPCVSPGFSFPATPYLISG